MRNVEIVVDDEPDPAHVRDGRELLGLYEGVPLTSRAAYGVSYHGLPMPDRITIFRLPICRMCATCFIEEVIKVARHSQRGCRMMRSPRQ